MRGYLLDSKLPKAKAASSKSPGSKKGALEFTTNHLKFDESSKGSPRKGNANNQEVGKNKTRDFHKEIERRYQRSESNQNYVFPRKHSHSLSSNGSLESLKDALIYNLHSVGDMVRVLKDDKRRTSGENSLGVSLIDSERPSARQIQTAREAFNESIRFSSKKPRKCKQVCQTSREHTVEKRIVNSSEKPKGKKEKRKRLKLSISQSRKALQINNSTKQTDMKDSVENTTTVQAKAKKRSAKRSHVELLAKTISLNINEETKKAKSTKRKPDLTPLASSGNIMMNSFFPKMMSTKSSKDLHCYSTKHLSHTGNFFKASEVKTAKADASHHKGAMNAMLSTMSSLPDKSLMSLKSSYSVFQNDPEKMNRSKTKLMNLRSTLETSENHSSLLSSIPAEVPPSTSRGASKSRGGKTKTNSLYQKTREDLMNRLRSSSGKNQKSPALSPLRDLVKIPLTTRAREDADEMMMFIKKKIQSPKFENVMLASLNLRTSGGFQKSLSGVKSAKDLHKIDTSKKSVFTPTNSKVVHKSIKLKDENKLGLAHSMKESKERVKGADLKKIHIDLQKSVQFDKSKIKLNLHSLSQRVAPLSDRAAITDDRSMNKQHYSNQTDYFK